MAIKLDHSIFFFPISTNSFATSDSPHVRISGLDAMVSQLAYQQFLKGSIC